jgi:hypothetical protein
MVTSQGIIPNLVSKEIPGRRKLGTIDEKKGRTLIYGCATLAAIQRDSQLEERLDALEAAQAEEGNR